MKPSNSNPPRFEGKPNYGIAANLAPKERRRFARHIAVAGRFAMFDEGADLDHASEVADRVDTEETWTRLAVALKEMDDTS